MSTILSKVHIFPRGRIGKAFPFGVHLIVLCFIRTSLIPGDFFFGVDMKRIRAHNTFDTLTVIWYDQVNGNLIYR